MQRYFFDLWEDNHLTRDEVGVELGGRKSARLEAIQAIAEIGAELFPAGNVSRLAFDIRHANQPLFKVTLTLEEASVGE